MPLPFRSPNVVMPNNRSYAAKRLNGLLRTLKRKPQMPKDYVEFMGKILDKGHAVRVPPEEIPAGEGNGNVWYLPHFGVYHPKKPDQIRVVFDSSAEYQGTSLNRELLTGPDLTKSLVGVLIRFRREEVAAMCDVEQMFHSFHVDPRHRDFLRFLWFTDNDPSKPVTENKMTVHPFGNGPSPAIATFGLRRTVENGEEFGSEVQEFVRRNFCVDDGLVSKPTVEETIRLVRATQAALATANLRLHKVVSNFIAVMEAFPTEDLAKDIRSLDLHHNELPAQRSLGVAWDLERDAFTYKVSTPDRPFTRRGVLSLVNSIYDPLGLAAPILLEGRLLLKQLVTMGKKTSNSASLGWDDPLPEALARRWQRWKSGLLKLEDMSVRRCYHPKNFGAATRVEVHAFSDASQRAIGAAVYLRQFKKRDEAAVSLVFGRANVAPTNPVSIPRLELCGAVLAAQATDKIVKEMEMPISKVVFYTDSKVVIGYITNESRRFYVYLANRSQLIRKISTLDQWRYVESSTNPADQATRGLHSEDLAQTPNTLGNERFQKFSSWVSLRRAIAILIAKARSLKQRRTYEISPEYKLGRVSTETLGRATDVIIKAVQAEAFKDDFTTLACIPTMVTNDRNTVKARKKSQKGSTLYRLDPYIDDDGILRVGGRLRHANFTLKEKQPVLLPREHHVSKLLAYHYHEQVHHQGRQITHGALRNAGHWLIGGHAAIAKLIGACVICKRLRGSVLKQHMADLPSDRVQTGPPFTQH